MLTYVLAVYGQPDMLAKQFDTWRKYDEDIRRQLRVFIVDDHGFPPAFVPDGHGLGEVRLYRVLDDIAWNQMGARNLGMHHADGWCVMLDPDMVIDAAMGRRFFAKVSQLRSGTVVRYGLRHVRTGKVDQSSPNTWFIHRDDFWDVGGYDEDYRGNKGWSDVQLLHVLTGLKKVVRTSLSADFYLPTDGIADARVDSLVRDTRTNKAMHIDKIRHARRGGWRRFVEEQKRRGSLRFRWERSQ